MTRGPEVRIRATRRLPRRALVRVAGLLALAAVGPGAALAGPAMLSGEVARGQVFAREIAPGLWLRLAPTEFGWRIGTGGTGRTGASAGSDADWSAVVTPPFRGVTPLDIEGWHFRNADNSGPNAPGPLKVNAPQRVREFAFVWSDADYRAARETLEKLLWPSSPAERDAALAAFEAVEARAGRARLMIEDLRLGNLVVGQQAWIEHMRFTVEFPDP